MSSYAWTLLSLLFLGLAGTSARAHHSCAVHFIPTGQAQVEGTVTDIRIRSPHSFLELDVRAAEGVYAAGAQRH